MPCFAQGTVCLQAACLRLSCSWLRVAVGQGDWAAVTCRAAAVPAHPSPLTLPQPVLPWGAVQIQLVFEHKPTFIKQREMRLFQPTGNVQPATRCSTCCRPPLAAAPVPPAGSMQCA